MYSSILNVCYIQVRTGDGETTYTDVYLFSVDHTDHTSSTAVTEFHSVLVILGTPHLGTVMERANNTFFYEKFHVICNNVHKF